jgi:serine/threonine protein phosphatase 1
VKKYAISDIHGCIRSFESLLDKIALSTADELYLLGDYIDRGPGSKEVLDLIMKMRADGYTVHALAGNHDYAMLDARTDHSFYEDWYFGWGGRETMESFGTKSLENVDQKYWDFISELDIVLEVDEYILVHAGINFSAKNPLKPDASMFYLRYWYGDINYDWLDDRIIVHGHTPVTTEESQSMLRNVESQGYLDIDTGCFAIHKPGKGHLTAFDLTNRKLHLQPCLDDVSGYWKGS